METQEIIEAIVKIIAAPIGITLLLYRIKKEIPFLRVTEAQQLDTARSILECDAGLKSNSHEYVKGLAARILAKSKFVSIQEIDILLKLPDPYKHVSAFPRIRSLLRLTKGDSPEFKFVSKYADAKRFNRRKTLAVGGYFSFGALAVFPILFGAGYDVFIFANDEYANKPSAVARDLFYLAIYTIPLFGYFAWECLNLYSRLLRAEELVESTKSIVKDVR